MFEEFESLALIFDGWLGLVCLGCVACGRAGI